MKQSVIYIYPSYSTFVKKDIDILSKKFLIKTQKHNWSDKKLIVIRLIQQFIFLSRNAPTCRVVFVMFGGYWSLLPSIFGKLLNKPVFIILGGTDCVSFPNLNYGSLRKPIMKYFIKWSYQICHTLLPVDESLVYNKYYYYNKSNYKQQGYKFFFPHISTPYKVIPNGFDPVFWDGIKHVKKHNTFICVAHIPNMMRFKLKGIDIVLKLASIYEHCYFTIVGVSEVVVRQINITPKNITFLPSLSQEKFKDYLLQSEFVLQLSISEGFPNTLCEAMLCRCIPIGSAVGAIPSIIGNTGYIIESSKMEHVKRNFNKALELNSIIKLEMAEKARNRVVENYHISKREKSFAELINENR